LEKETLNLKDIISILGNRPFPPKENFKAYLETKKQEVNETKKKEDESSETKNAV
jgi:AFG3 family protein